MSQNSVCVVMQPTVFPWIGYFDLIDQATKFVFYDDVQFVKRSWQIRNRIKSANEPITITIPVKKDGLVNINEVLIDNSQNWRRKQLNTFLFNYKKSSHFEQIFNFVEEFYNLNHEYLSDFTIGFIEQTVQKLNIKTELIRSSTLTDTQNFVKDVRLAIICKVLQCDTYLSTTGSSTYIEENNPGGEIAKNGINVYYHQYLHPEYDQINGKFEPYMGIIDLLFNEGFDKSLEIIRSGRRKSMSSELFRRDVLKL